MKYRLSWNDLCTFLKSNNRKPEVILILYLLSFFLFVAVFAVIIMTYADGKERLDRARTRVERIEKKVEKKRNIEESDSVVLKWNLFFEDLSHHYSQEGLLQNLEEKLLLEKSPACFLSKEILKLPEPSIEVKAVNEDKFITASLLMPASHTITFLNKLEKVSTLESAKEKVILQEFHLKKKKISDDFEIYECELKLIKKEICL